MSHKPKKLKTNNEPTACSSSNSSNSGGGIAPNCIIHFSDSKSDKVILLSESEDPNGRLQKLQDICQRRLSQPSGSVHRMEDVCAQVPTSYTPERKYGYHRVCYQRFTGNLNRLKATISSEDSAQPRTHRSASGAKYIFSPECIFCDKSTRKKIKKGSSWTTEGLAKFEFDGGDSILQTAESRKDFDMLRKIKGYDLFACEAQYHPSCRKAYTREPSWLSCDVDQKEQQSALESAHTKAYTEVCAIIDDRLIKRQEVIKMTDLLAAYINILDGTEFANQSYRSENLKSKLIKTYRDQLSFVQLQNMGKYQSSLVYSSNIDVDAVIRKTYELSNSNQLEDTALSLRAEISKTFKGLDKDRWPPSAKELELSQETILPPAVKQFLHVLLTGNTGITHSEKTHRLILSLGQDLCRVVTNGHWKLPKHILLSMTLRHMFRSADLITLISRLGHCENYSFAVELETALATVVHQSSFLLTPQIIRHPTGQALFHSDFDNFDTFTATGSVHTAHGIMLQECEDPGGSATTIDIPTLERTKQRSLQIAESADEMTECYVTQRKSPPYNISQWTCPAGEEAIDRANTLNILWMFSRWMSSSNNAQEVPGWSGFVSSTGNPPTSTTTVDYYPVINSPITDYKTVQQCLYYSEAASREVGQDYVITTFDLGVCMKAYPLTWNDPNRYSKHIIMIGSFHAAAAYLKMIGKKMRGTGLDDILIEAGLITSGSLHGVLSGTNYSRAMMCHKTVLEALERLLLVEFIVSEGRAQLINTPDQESLMTDLLETPSRRTINAVLEDKPTVTLVQKYMAFKESCRNGALGKTAQLWTSYMDHVWLLLNVIQAVKDNDYDLYCHSLYRMCDLFFSFDGQNYARYLTFFSVFLANVDQTHPGARALLERGAFSVARSFVPGNRCPVDKTIEETFMKHSKSHGGAGSGGTGLKGIVNDYRAYQRWVKTTHERTQFVEVMFSMANMLNDSRDDRKHKDLRPSEVKKSETRVTRTVDAIKSFMNPFDTQEVNKLYCLSSGAATPSDIEEDVLGAEKIGKRAKETFIRERLEEKDHFFEPVKRARLKTMGDNKKKAMLTSKTNKVIEYRQQSTILMKLLVQRGDGSQVDLEDLVKYPLTPVPYSIATADGFFNKTDKAKGFHFLVKSVDNSPLPSASTTLVIEDGNALFHYLREVPGNFKDICQKLFDMMIKTSDVVFSTDMYISDSVKSMERRRRGCGEKLIVQGEKTKRPADWKAFLTNDENKVQLIQLMLHTWSQDYYAPKYNNRKIIFISNGSAYRLRSDDKKHTKVEQVGNLHSNQEETDSRIVLYCKYAQDQGYETVRVRSPDSDVFFILIHHALSLHITILFDTGTGNSKRLINITELVSGFTQMYCTALTSLHAFTHCDSTSAFKGIGKVKPIKVLQRNPRFQNVLAQLGAEWEVSSELESGLEAFTCALYGRNRVQSVDELRCILMREKCGINDTGTINVNKHVDLSGLPPCRQALIQHIRRVNYQMAIWRRANVATVVVPKATDGHGWVDEDGQMVPLWFEGRCVPGDPVEDQHLEQSSDSEPDDGEEDLSLVMDESDSDDEY